MDKKLKKLKAILKELGSAVVAYSGGVDSTFLLKVAKEVLGKDNILAVTAKSELFPESELKDAKRIARRLGIRHMIIRSHELKNKNFVKNPVNRCYYCKKELFSRLKRIAKDRNIGHVIDGTNFDDLKDLRFGREAALELSIKSPLMKAGLTKPDVRKISKKMKLPTWSRGTFACLASRFPYNQRISKEDLKRIEELEDFLKSLSFNQFRVRLHRNLARIEIEKKEIFRLLRRKDIREKIVNRFKDSNISYVTVDLAGYRSGSMNEVLMDKYVA